MNRTKQLRVILFLGCLAMAVWWMLLKHEQRSLVSALKRVSNHNASVSGRLETKKSEYFAFRASLIPEAQLSPDEKRRQRVVKLVAQIKEERAKRTTPLPPPPPEGPGGDTFRELMDDPEYARLTMVIWRYGWLDQNARRFQWAKIPSEKQEKLNELILDVGFSGDDALITAQKHGLSSEEAWKVREKVKLGVETEIQELLGRETYEQLQRGRVSSGSNELSKNLQTRLSYSDTPLSKEQAQQVYEAMIERRIPHMLKPEQIEPLIERAKPALSSEQLGVFRQVVTEYNYGKWEGPVTVSEPKK